MSKPQHRIRRAVQQRAVLSVMLVSLAGVALYSCGQNPDASSAPTDAAAAAAGISDTVIIAGYADCRGCIQFEAVATLGHPSDPISPFFATMPLRLGNGWFVLAPLREHPGLAMYDSVGRFRALYGRAGDGPGEFRRVSRIVKGTGDTIYALDRNRITVLAWARDSVFEIVRTIAVAGRVLPEFAVTRDGEILITGPQRQGPEMGPPVHVVGADGAITRSFGQLLGPAHLDRPWAAERHIATGRSGLVAVAPRNRYEIEIYGSGGVSPYLIQRRVPWFPEWLDVSDGILRPAIGSIWIDPYDRLWVTVSLPRRGERDIGSWGWPTAQMIHDLRDSIIEVFDLAERRLLASARTESVMALTHDGHIASPIDGELGHISTRVWRIGLSLAAERSRL